MPTALRSRRGRPPPQLRARIETFFDPLPFYYAPLEVQCTEKDKYPLAAITQRPMAMYHSWDSQNAWLRQIHSHNYLHVNPVTAQAAGVADGGWCWVTSAWGRVRCMVRYSDAVEPGTVWTWNAIGKRSGAWQLEAGADESRKGFLLNHLITEELPFAGGQISNSDPVTGQAGWYDVRDETFYAEGDTVLGDDGQRVAADTGHVVTWTEEQTYFFRLSAYTDRLQQFAGIKATILAAKRELGVAIAVDAQEGPLFRGGAYLADARAADRLVRHLVAGVHFFGGHPFGCQSAAGGFCRCGICARPGANHFLAGMGCGGVVGDRHLAPGAGRTRSDPMEDRGHRDVGAHLDRGHFDHRCSPDRGALDFIGD